MHRLQAFHFNYLSRDSKWGKGLLSLPSSVPCASRPIPSSILRIRGGNRELKRAVLPLGSKTRLVIEVTLALCHGNPDISK